MRSNIRAKSQESVPPAPAFISTKQSFKSVLPTNNDSISNIWHFASSFLADDKISFKDSWSFSVFAREKYSAISSNSFSIAESPPSLSSRADFSLRIIWAFS
jgi:hypothetical protein